MSTPGRAGAAAVIAAVAAALAGGGALAGAQREPAGGHRVPAGRVVCPLPGAVLTSGWGPRRGGFHDGVDLAAPAGTPIRSVATGVVTRSATADPGGYGQLIDIRHGDGSTAQYGHMRRRLVHTGQPVTAGQVIAEVGAEGQATGPHLHLRIYQRTSSRTPSADDDNRSASSCRFT